MKGDGNLTQGEDIADNGGLREAFFAYQKWAANNKNVDNRLPGLQKYSSEQLFFINYAKSWCIKMTNAHALNRLRTDVHSLGPTSNRAWRMTDPLKPYSSELSIMLIEASVLRAYTDIFPVLM
ncbi:unnamed protein product [Rotaria sordida]|uniref:Peptidase M13 C-terminal domain-containing protein n=1 Tax=Rotaria sordida TaxID=392033 RepID=A0A814G4B5_9BILA|nr:unnamed protein product [Rotaria sordida]CAF0988955.1 unnamed protein product [Rotaria sordida]